MKKFLASTLLVLAVFTAAVFARAQGGQNVQEIIKVTPFNTASIVITGDAQLAQFAHQAFQSHGRYVRVARDGSFTLTFTRAGEAQVRVDVAKAGGALVASRTAGGKDLQDALYRAADAAVRETGGGNGYFAARLAFVRKTGAGKGEIHIGDLFLNQVRRLTDHGSDILTPRWSPDGTKLLYTSFFIGGNPDIYQIDLAAGRWTPFASYKGTNMGARFSPDGSRVVMVLSGNNGAPNLYTIDACGQGKPAALTSTQEAKSSPCYSPDGRRIVFAKEPGPQLHLINAAGGEPERLRLSAGGNYAAEPDWSRAKPNLIVFTTRQGGVFRVAVHDLATGKTRVIAPKDANGVALDGDFIEPVWLPDGRHVVCTHRTPGARSLHILDTGENSSNRATKISSGYAELPSVWSP